MLELFKSLSDDQIALLGCAVALTIAGTVMSLSYYIGRARIAANGRVAANPSLPAEASPQIAQGAVEPTSSNRRNAA
jgi:hypothetical protein